jgi:phosphatidylserine decarboxylase
MTLYLSPGDYHRIHSPVTGTITGYLNVPGKLFTVQDYMVRSLKGLFVMNERIVTYIQSASGMVAVCKVGAFNVGRISLAYSDIVTNRFRRRREEIFFNGKDRVPVEACDEIGVFHLGSTIILLFEKNSITFNNDLKPGGKIRMGKAIGSLR